MASFKGYGKIFIAWSDADSGKVLAKKVKDCLEKKQYDAIIGGEDLHGAVYIGETIFQEIDQCVNAIILLSNPGDRGLSFNVAIEWGYCHRRFNKSEEAYLLNGATLNEFDIQGINANPIEERIDFTNEEQIERIANQIVETFVAKQNLRTKEADIECLELISDYSMIENEIEDYTISQYDLARHILFYTQSAYIFHRIEDAKKVLNDFKANHDLSDQPLLSLSIDYSFASFDMFNRIFKTKGRKSISNSDFINIKSIYEDLLARANELDNSSFLGWLLVSIYKNLNYIYYIKALEIGSSANDQYLNLCYEYGNKCIDVCNRLEAMKPTQINYARLCKSYMYRNFYIIGVANNNPNAREYAKKALETKRTIYYQTRDNQNLSKGLLEYIETEYNLSLAESIKYMDDPIEILGNVEILNNYCESITNSTHRRLSSLEYIRDVISKEKLQLFIIDFDLTIADTIEASKIAYHQAFEAAGALKQYNEKNVIYYLNEHLKNTFNQISGSAIEYNEFLNIYIDTFNKNIDKVKVYPDAIDFLKLLKKKGKRVVIFSNRDTASIKLIFKNNNLEDLTPLILSSSDTVHKRKSPADIEQFMKNYSASTDNTIYFGDSDEDKSCALCAEVAFVRVDRYYIHHENKCEIINNLSNFYKQG